MAEENSRLICRAECCGKVANRVGAGLCEAHYAKLRRYGDPNHKIVAPDIRVHSGGYLQQCAPGHKLANGGLRAYQHRLVYHAEHGDGPFNCHWCGKRVTWDTMHVDHLNDQVGDNRPENLVAACPECNMHRNVENQRASYRRRFGLTVDGETKTIAEWAAGIGISHVSLKSRIAAGWDLRRAVTEPRGVTGPKAKTAAESRGQVWDESAAPAPA